MNHPELTTIKDFIRYAISRFNAANLYYGHGTDNAWDEAFALILTALHLPHDIEPALLDTHVTSEENTTLSELIELRISKRMPIAYLTHEAWFCGLPFYVNEQVLIPRSPMAEVIEQQFQPWIQAEEVNNILDLCTGSGCIAVACAKAFPEADVDASDVSKAALDIAKINVERHDVSEQVHLYHSDLFAQLPEKKYDVIISNPPYVSTQEMKELPAEYLHEPSLALQAGPEGLDFAIRIMKDAPKYLTEHGILILEVGNSEYALAEKFPEVPFTWLEFANGEDGVFMLTRDQLLDFSQ